MKTDENGKQQMPNYTGYHKYAKFWHQHENCTF